MELGPIKPKINPKMNSFNFFTQCIFSETFFEIRLWCHNSRKCIQKLIFYGKGLIVLLWDYGKR